MLIALTSALLAGAVVYDLVSHRLPNYYLLIALVVSLAVQAGGAGWDGLLSAGAGLLTGFALFIPLYAMGGMAAGDVKLMAVVGSFLGASGALWAGVYSLIAGAVLGIIYLLYKRQFAKLWVRYWLMAVTHSRIAAEEGDAARHRFPYALAIAIGTLSSLYWTPV